jgi:tRNA(Ile2) C34 agmatinyltransferase TiaS
MKIIMNDQNTETHEILCPACGAVLTEKERAQNGWNCRCGEFIPESLAIRPREGLSNQHKQNRIWR